MPCIYRGKHHSTLNQALYIWRQTSQHTEPGPVYIYGGKHHSTLNQALYIWRETSQHTEPCHFYIEGNITAHWTRPCLYRGKHHSTLNQALYIWRETSQILQILMHSTYFIMISQENTKINLVYVLDLKLISLPNENLLLQSISLALVSLLACIRSMRQHFAFFL